MTHLVIVCYKTINSTWGLFNHYFFKIPHINLEIHPGNYKLGTHHTDGFTKYYIEYEYRWLCNNCLKILLELSSNLYKVWYYPYINCETLTRTLIGSTPISFQTIYVTIIIASLISCIFLVWMIPVSIFIILLFIYNNNCYFPVHESYCEHLKRDGQYEFDDIDGDA